MAFAITTFAPSEMPIRKFTISPITGPFAPTAATAAVLLSPAKLPTTARSDALKSCSSIAVAATGSANSGSLLQIGPFSISIFFAPERFISFPAFFERFHVLKSVRNTCFAKVGAQKRKTRQSRKPLIIKPSALVRITGVEPAPSCPD